MDIGRCGSKHAQLCMTSFSWRLWNDHISLLQNRMVVTQIVTFTVFLKPTYAPVTDHINALSTTKACQRRPSLWVQHMQSDKKTSVPALFWSRICSWTKYVCTLVSVNHVAVHQAYLDVETNSTLNRTVQPIIVKLCSGINTAESTQQNQHSGSWVHKSKRTHAPLSPDALNLTDTDSSD